jgi:AbrB family looped-hinge helix DNA binding protein
MQTTIDNAGRVVIPKAVRDRLGLVPGSPIEIHERDGRLELEAMATPMHLVPHGHGVAAVPDTDLPALTDAIVRATLERSRR